jgi:hypothetical protein
MTLRTEVQKLLALGPFPPSKMALEEDLFAREAALNAIKAPLNDEEAAALVDVFGPDDCFGLAWTLLHLIETAPSGCPVRAEPSKTENEWKRRLWERAQRKLE